MRFWRYFILGATAVALAAPSFAAKTPEEETLEISRLLRPVPNDEWRQIAGEHLAEEYTIIQGDTLYDISNRLFGDPRYWPKIWALNNTTITNPHLIMPDNLINFTPGSGTSLPMVAISTADEVEQTLPKQIKPKVKVRKAKVYITPGIPRTKGRSQEWRKLPRQEWEGYEEQLPDNVDASGFDRRSRVFFATRSTIDMPVIIAEDQLDPSGTIEGAITERAFLNLGDEVVISPERDGGIQVGDVYAIVGDPNSIGGGDSDRSAYSYPVFGKVKITTVRDNQFVGTLISLRLQISRGNQLVPLPPSPVLADPVAGPNTMQAVVLKDPFLTPGTLGQQKFALIDRGSSDGIKTGMIFRSYSHDDPFSGDRLMDADLFPDTEFIVAYAWPKMSLSIQVRGDQLYEQGINVTLLTDVSDVKRPSGVRVRLFDTQGTKGGDESLEGLDTSPGIGKREEEELRELEDAATGKTQAPPPPADGSEPPPPPDGEELPPPDAPISGGDEIPPPLAPLEGTEPPPPPSADAGQELDIGDSPAGGEEPPPPES